MRAIAACLAAVSLVSAISANCLGADATGSLQIVRAIVTSDPDGRTPDDLRIRLYVKNTGAGEITVLTRSLGVTLFGYTNKPAELSLDLSTQMNIEGSPMIPSLYDLSPVVLKSGEVAEIQVPYRDRKNLDKVVLVYDMRNSIARRFNAWDGIVRSETVGVMTAKARPQAASEPTGSGP